MGRLWRPCDNPPMHRARLRHPAPAVDRRPAGRRRLRRRHPVGESVTVRDVVPDRLLAVGCRPEPQRLGRPRRDLRRDQRAGRRDPRPRGEDARHAEHRVAGGAGRGHPDVLRGGLPGRAGGRRRAALPGPRAPARRTRSWPTCTSTCSRARSPACTTPSTSSCTSSRSRAASAPVEKVSYAHEYDHALQDQHFDLEAIQAGLEGQSRPGAGAPVTGRGRRVRPDDRVAAAAPDPGRDRRGHRGLARPRGPGRARADRRRSSRRRSCSRRSRAWRS